MSVSHMALFLAPFCSHCICINDISSDIQSEIRLIANERVCYHEIKNKGNIETSEIY